MVTDKGYIAYNIYLIAHATHISMSGLKSDITIVFLNPDFL